MTQCKPGDLAMVVRNSRGLDHIDFFIGTPLQVEYQLNTPLGPAWSFTGRPLRCQCGGNLIGFLDADLQPLRPRPADRATDHIRDVLLEIDAHNERKRLLRLEEAIDDRNGFAHG